MKAQDKIEKIAEFIEFCGADPVIKFRTGKEPTRLSSAEVGTAILYISAIDSMSEINEDFAASIVGAMFDDKTQTAITFVFDRILLECISNESFSDFSNNFDLQKNIFTVSPAGDDAAYICDFIEMPIDQWECCAKDASFFVKNHSLMVH